MAVWQSETPAHVLKSTQRGQDVVPPQSTSDSPWFFTPSVQLGATHLPNVHTPDAQSAPILQTPPSGQRAQSTPPQSTSVSKPFCTLSVQFAAPQAFTEQILLVQAVSETQ